MSVVSTIRDEREELMNALEGKSVLVTGSSGLLGEAVVERLTKLDSPIRVTGLSRSGSYSVENPNYISVAADLANGSSNETLEKIEFSHLVHCAAVIPTSMVDSSATQVAEMNSLMDDRIVSLCHDRGAKLIYVSSASVYGFGHGPWNEDSSTCASSPYVTEKLLSEQKALHKLMDCVVLRVTAPYGSRQSARTVLRLFIERALKGEELLFHGSGQRTQDFIAADDFALAVESVLIDNNIKGVSGIFNIAGGCPISTRDLAELVIASVPGTRSRVAPSGQIDPQEGYRPCFDLRKAGDLLKWKPRITLSQGIEKWVNALGAQTRMGS